MKDQFELATTVPHSEQCVQLGAENYSRFSKMEADALKEQIFRMFGAPPPRCGIKMISCPHDFGTYYDLAVVYDDESEEATQWMLKIEGSIPEYWDEEAKKELREKGYDLEFADVS